MGDAVRRFHSEEFMFSAGKNKKHEFLLKRFRDFPHMAEHLIEAI